MTIQIHDWNDKPTLVKLDKPVKRIECHSISGDEVLTVLFCDGDVQVFDSSKTRILGLPDYIGITIYDNGVINAKWSNRFVAI